MTNLTPNQFNEMSNLYHYTTFNNLALILDSMSLRCSKLIGMNDFTEVEKVLFFEEISENNDELRNLITEKYNTIGQISFSQDNKGNKGYAINSMWGHYANKSEGCCLVFNKNKIITEAERKGYFFSSVKYNKGNTDCSIPPEVKTESDVEKHFKNNWKSIFCNKTTDWKNEQEYRILDLSFNKDPQKLSIKDSLLGVIFHTICFDPTWNCPLIRHFIDKLKSMNLFALSYEYSNMLGGKKGYVLKDYEGEEWNEITKIEPVTLAYDNNRFHKEKS